MRRNLLIAALGLLAAGCGDDEHKGSFSTGTAKPMPSASAVPTERLVYQPGTPIASMRVAQVFKRRLARAKLDGAVVKIGGEAVHVHAPKKDLAAVKKALEGGRLDLHLFDRLDPFASIAPDELAPLTRESETVATKDGPKTVFFLVAKTADRKALTERVTKDKAGALALIGPYGEGFRSYFADAEREVRGEMVKKAVAEEVDGGVQLVITFEGNGKSFLRWQSSQKGRVLLRVNDEVLGALAPAETITDGVLRVSVAKMSIAAAKELAATIDGVALSHDVVMGDEKK